MADSSEEKGAEAVPSAQEDATTTEAAEKTPKNFKAILLGATGATGRFVVGELLASKDFKEITLLGRRKFTEIPENFKIDLEQEEASGHLKQIVIDMEEANEENSLKYFEGMDAFVTCFGTTRANAGSNANFRHIDYGYNVKFAEIAKKAGVGFCCLLSSSGAHPRSYMNYLKVKGEIEDAITKLEFPLLTVFRPGLLDRKQHQRFLEKLAGMFMTKMPVDTLAKAIVADAVNQLSNKKSGEHYSHILSNHQILDLARAYKKSQQPPSEAVEASQTEEGATEASKEGEGEEAKQEEVKAEEGKSDEGKSVEGEAEEPKADEGKAAGEQPQDSEKTGEEPQKGAGNEVDQAAEGDGTK